MIGAAVVGYGYAGRSFHAYLIGLAEGIELRAVSTRDPERRRAAAADYPDARIYARFEDLLADERIDLVVVATPHYTHRDLAIQAMEAGKHVVVDKIMCMDARQAEEMIEASRRNQVLLSVFHNRRWDWDYLTVRKVIEEGLLGEPYLFETGIMRYSPPRGWRALKAKSGGILFDWPAHFVDQALQLVDAAVERVYCETVSRDRWEGDLENYARLLLSFSSGVLYQIEVGNLAAAGKPRWYVAGDLGGLVKHGIDPQEPFLRERRIEEAEEDPQNRARVYTVVDGRMEERVIDSVRGSWTSYYQNISEVLNQGAELAVKPEEILRVMQVYDAAVESEKTGRSVSCLI